MAVEMKYLSSEAGEDSTSYGKIGIRFKSCSQFYVSGGFAGVRNARRKRLELKISAISDTSRKGRSVNF